MAIPRQLALVVVARAAGPGMVAPNFDLQSIGAFVAGSRFEARLLQADRRVGLDAVAIPASNRGESPAMERKRAKRVCPSIRALSRDGTGRPRPARTARSLPRRGDRPGAVTHARGKQFPWLVSAGCPPRDQQLLDAVARGIWRAHLRCDDLVRRRRFCRRAPPAERARGAILGASRSRAGVARIGPATRYFNSHSTAAIGSASSPPLNNVTPSALPAAA